MDLHVVHEDETLTLFGVTRNIFVSSKNTENGKNRPQTNGRGLVRKDNEHGTLSCHNHSQKAPVL